jgi:hypothetical protein
VKPVKYEDIPQDIIERIKQEIMADIRQESFLRKNTPWSSAKEAFETYLRKNNADTYKVTQYVSGLSGLCRFLFKVKRVEMIHPKHSDKLEQFTNDLIQLMEQYREEDDNG